MAQCRHCGAEHPDAVAACPKTGDAVAAPGPCGGQIDRYQVLTLLGVGGFGAVYRARHVHTDQVVALKVLKRQLGTDPGMLDRLLREAKAAASVGSEHIVRVADAGIASDGQAFLVMELLDGWDLKEMVTRGGPLQVKRTALIVLQVLEGLSAAHAKGIVHRDMKPANVFLQRKIGESGVERDFVKLLDFGISKMHEEQQLNSLTLPGMAMGTPAYMAPEQFGSARDVDPRADLYSVAVMLYELLGGRLPFEAQTYVDLAVKVRTEVASPLAGIAPHLPAALCAAVDRGLARDPARRWQTALEFGDSLRAALGIPRRPATGQLSGPTPPARAAPITDPALRATYTPNPALAGDGPATGVRDPVSARAAAGTRPLSEASMLGQTAPPTPRPELANAVAFAAQPAPLHPPVRATGPAWTPAPPAPPALAQAPGVAAQATAVPPGQPLLYPAPAPRPAPAKPRSYLGCGVLVVILAAIAAFTIVSIAALKHLNDTERLRSHSESKTRSHHRESRGKRAGPTEPVDPPEPRDAPEPPEPPVP